MLGVFILFSLIVGAAGGYVVGSSIRRQEIKQLRDAHRRVTRLAISAAPVEPFASTVLDELGTERN